MESFSGKRLEDGGSATRLSRGLLLKTLVSPTATSVAFGRQGRWHDVEEAGRSGFQCEIFIPSKNILATPSSLLLNPSTTSPKLSTSKTPSIPSPKTLRLPVSSARTCRACHLSPLILRTNSSTLSNSPSTKIAPGYPGREYPPRRSSRDQLTISLRFDVAKRWWLHRIVRLTRCPFFSEERVGCSRLSASPIWHDTILPSNLASEVSNESPFLSVVSFCAKVDVQSSFNHVPNSSTNTSRHSPFCSPHAHSTNCESFALAAFLSAVLMLPSHCRYAIGAAVSGYCSGRESSSVYDAGLPSQPTFSYGGMTPGKRGEVRWRWRVQFAS